MVYFATSFMFPGLLPCKRGQLLLCLFVLYKLNEMNGIFTNNQKHNDLLQITTGTQISTNLTIPKDVYSQSLKLRMHYV